MSEDVDDPREGLLAGGNRPEGQSANVTADDSEPPAREGLFGVLSNRRRRYALRCLEACETPMAVADLADELARRETDGPAVRDVRERLRISLYHRHLPKMADADLVSFDEDDRTVDIRDGGTDRPLTGVQAGVEEHT